MATTNDSLELKVSSAEYTARIGQLDTQFNNLRTILEDYKQLKNDARKIFGDEDENLVKIEEQVQKNIDAVQGQMNLLDEARKMLRTQEEQLGLLGSNLQTAVSQAATTAKSAFNTISIVGELVK